MRERERERNSVIFFSFFFHKLTFIRLHPNGHCSKWKYLPTSVSKNGALRIFKRLLWVFFCALLYFTLPRCFIVIQFVLIYPTAYHSPFKCPTVLCSEIIIRNKNCDYSSVVLAPVTWQYAGRHLNSCLKRAVTESDLRTENKAESEKLLVLPTSANMRLIPCPWARTKFSSR